MGENKPHRRTLARGLQTELAEVVYDRPRAVTVELFVGKVIIKLPAL